MKMYDPEDTYIDFDRRYDNAYINVHYNKEETRDMVLAKFNRKAREICGKIEVREE